MTGDYQRESVLMNLDPNAQLRTAKVVEQEEQRNATVEETQQENIKMCRRYLPSPEAPPISGQYMASDCSLDNDVTPLSRQVSMTKETLEILANGLPDTDNPDDETESDDGSDGRRDGLLPVESMMQRPLTTMISCNDSSPMDARGLAGAVATRSLDNSYKDELRGAGNVSSKDSAPMGTSSSEIHQQMLIPVLDPEDYNGIDDTFCETKADHVEDSSPAFDSPKKAEQVFLPDPDESAESEPPTKRRRTRRSLRSARDSTIDSTVPSKIELLLSSHVRLDDKSRDFFDGQGVSILAAFEQRPEPSSLVHIIPDKGPFRTVKVLRTIVAKGTVVKRSWVRDSIRKSKMQPLQAYVPPVLETSIEVDRTIVFAGRTLMFTPTAQNKIEQWKEVCALAREAGCVKIQVASEEPIMFPPSESTICLFGDNSAGDKDAAAWLSSHRVVWDWHLLARAILAGRLDLEDDHYMLSLPLGSRSIKYEY
jgi:hypothetical protein